MNRKTARLVSITAILIVGLVFALAGCGPRNTTSGKPFRITITTWVGFAPLYLAQEKGFFKQYGLDKVEIIRMDDAGIRKASMQAGRIEGYGSSVDNWAIDSAQGLQGVIVMALDESAGGDGIVAKKSIRTVKDLKGKTVAVQTGMPGQFLLFHLIKQASLKPTDIKTVEMDSDKAGAAFVAGKLDAAVTWEPWLSKSAQAGGHVLVSTKDCPGLIVDTLVVPTGIMKDRPQDVQAVMKAWNAAVEYWRAHKDESDAIMAKPLGLPKADFAAMCSGVRFYDLKTNKSYFGTKGKRGQIYEVFESAGRVWKEQGLTKKVTSSKSAIDDTGLISAID